MMTTSKRERHIQVNGSSTIAILSAIIGAMFGALAAIIIYGATVSNDVSEMRAEIASLKRTIDTIPYPWNTEASVRWRARVDQHLDTPGIHQTPDQKKALINEVLDERERRARRRSTQKEP